MTQNAQKLHAHLIEQAQSQPSGNTVVDAAAQTGLDEGQMERAIEELQNAGLVRRGQLWGSIGDHRDVVAIGRAQYGPRV